jgi:hypothetical protein
MTEALSARAFEAFLADNRGTPALTLRGGNSLDEYKEPEAFDPEIDAVSDFYFERYWWGVAHLDPRSWRYYLPHLIDYALRHRRENTMVIDALLTSLRPPDRQPARLASLSAEQEAVVSAFLDVMAFDDTSVHQDLARTALEEWWAPGALYRPSDAQPVDAPDRLPAGSRPPANGR